MASSSAVGVPAQNLDHENMIPLDSIITGEPSSLDERAAGGSVESEHVHSRSEPILSVRRPPWQELETQRGVLKKLKAWHQWDLDRYKSLSRFLMSKAGFPRRPIRPTPDQLSSLTAYFFPPRSSLRVIICDFGEERFERSDVELGDIQQCKSLFSPQWDVLNIGYD